MKNKQRQQTASILIVEDSKPFTNDLVTGLQTAGFMLQHLPEELAETAEGSRNPTYALKKDNISVFIVGCLTSINWAASLCKDLQVVFLDENLFQVDETAMDWASKVLRHERVSDVFHELLAVKCIENFYVISTDKYGLNRMTNIMQRAADNRPLESLLGKVTDDEGAEDPIKDPSLVLEKIALICAQYRHETATEPPKSHTMPGPS